MSDRATTWLILALMSLSVPVLVVFGMMYLAILPLAGVLMVLFDQFDIYMSIASAVNLGFYALMFYWPARGIAWLLRQLHPLARTGCLVTLCFASVATTFLPLYGICYAGCGHLSLWQFYRIAF